MPSWHSTARWPSRKSKAHAQALLLVEALPLTGYHLFHAVRADLLLRAGREAEAAAAWRAALQGCGNQREREFLQRQLDAATSTT